MSLFNIKSFGGVFLSNVIYNLSGLIVVLLAARMLPVEQYANFSLVLTIAFVLATALDFGMNLTLVKKYKNDKNREKLIKQVLNLKVLLAITSILLALINLLLLKTDSLLFLAFLVATHLNVWQCLRAIEQAKENNLKYTFNNIFFALLRGIIGTLVILYADTWENALYFGVVAPLIIYIAYALVKDGYSFNLFKLPTNDVLHYSKWVFLSSLFFTATIYSPQIVASYSFSPEEISVLGLCSGLIAVVPLIFNSIKFFIFPKVSNSEDDLNKMTISLFRRFPLFLAILAPIALISLIILDFLLGDKYDQTGLTFAILFSALMVNSYIGLINIGVHTINIPWMDALTNFLRVITVYSISFVYAADLFSLVLIYSFLLISFEVLLLLLVRFYRKKL